MPRKVDINQSQIVMELRQAGCTVACTHMLGHGFPDIIVGVRGRNYLVEIKGPRGRLTHDEEEWHASWRGQVCVARSTEEILKLIDEHSD